MPDGSFIASDIFAHLPEEAVPTRQPDAQRAFMMDVAETYIHVNQSIRIVQGYFYSLAYREKLLTLTRIFHMVQCGELDVPCQCLLGTDTAASLHRFYLDYCDKAEVDALAALPF